MFSLDEFNKILDYLKSMPVNSSRGIVYSSTNTIILFNDLYIIEINYKDNKFKINCYKNSTNIEIVNKYIHTNSIYKTKNKIVDNIINIKFNMILKEVDDNC